MSVLSKEERTYLGNIDFLLAKQRISKKVIGLLNETLNALEELVKRENPGFPLETLTPQGKISRGENYRSLPYWILDFPRQFDRNNTFALRTMVWWGNEISCTLHIGGNTAGPMAKRLGILDQNYEGFFFCLHKTPWEYHFGPDNYKPLSEVDFESRKSHIQSHHFFKLSLKFPLDELDLLPKKSEDYFKWIVQKLNSE